MENSGRIRGVAAGEGEISPPTPQFKHKSATLYTSRSVFQGRIQGGGGGVLGPPPTLPFGGTLKLHKEGKKRCMCAREYTTF